MKYAAVKLLLADERNNSSDLSFPVQIKYSKKNVFFEIAVLPYFTVMHLLP